MTLQWLPTCLVLLLLLGGTSLASSSWNFKLHGINYTLRIGADWYAYQDRCKSYTQAVTDMVQLKEIAHNVRIFSLNDCNAGQVLLQAVNQVGDLGLWLGLWVGEDGLNFQAEQQALLHLLDTYSSLFAAVQGIHVSSEAIYREDLTVQEAISYRNTIKADMVANGWPDIPVVVADIIDNYIQYPQLVTLDSVVHFNQFPFWERTTNINDAASYMDGRVDWLQNSDNRPIVIGETGWADAGSNPAANPANPPSMQKWLRDFYCLANQNGWQYYWFIAYDSDWRRVNENDPTGVEGHFGIYDENGTMKPWFQNFSIDCNAPAVTINPNSDTFPPVAAPANDPTDVPTTSPTASPTVPPTVYPTRSPTTAPTGMPAASTTTLPTSIPTQAPVLPPGAPTTSPVETTPDPTRDPVEATDLPTSNPTSAETSNPTVQPTSSPTFEPTEQAEAFVSAQCSDHMICSSLALAGQCCPTVDDWMLACCDSTTATNSGSNDGPPSDQCRAHKKCQLLGLADACCPTPTGVYLDCCDRVPNDCATSGTCRSYSAQTYLQEQQQQRSAAREVAPWMALIIAVGALLAMAQY